MKFIVRIDKQNTSWAIKHKDAIKLIDQNEDYFYYKLINTNQWIYYGSI